MPLEEFLFPNETITFSTRPTIEYAGNTGFQLFTTDQRLMLFARRGLVFKRDHIISIRLPDILEITYAEKGIFKKGLLSIQTKEKKTEFKGDTETVKEVAKILQNYLEKRKPQEEKSQFVQVNVQSPAFQKEVITREVVMIPCEYCGGVQPQTSVFCPNCGAQRRK
jgi:hypothetical protein